MAIVKGILWSPKSLTDYAFWRQNHKPVLTRLKHLIQDIQEHPTEGFGNPQPLDMPALPNTWARSIDQNHLLIYRLCQSQIHILSCKDSVTG